MPNLNLEHLAKCSVFSRLSPHSPFSSSTTAVSLSFPMTTTRPIDSACVTPSFLPSFLRWQLLTTPLIHSLIEKEERAREEDEDESNRIGGGRGAFTNTQMCPLPPVPVRVTERPTAHLLHRSLGCGLTSTRREAACAAAAAASELLGERGGGGEQGAVQ